ncbi:2-amino-4-hydroxy-6-hydroxymethyldihydropteridine diphosphokinase [Chloroflexota bacterium]
MNVETVIVYLSLGSNLGDHKENLDRALEYLSQRLRVTGKSSVYDTEPMENPAQPRFLNMVCQAKTMLKPEDLLTLVKGIERKMGRLPSRPNSPRPIDIDILFYGDKVISTPELKIPHPRMNHRAFVLVPLAEIAPTLVHPVNKKTAKEMLREIKKGVQEVLKLEEQGA